MYKKLLVIFASASILALVSFSAAFVFGGSELRNAFDDGNMHWTVDDYDGPISTREFAFDAGLPLTIDVPVDLRFERGAETSMTIEGPKEVVDALAYEKGVLTLGRGSSRLGDGLRVRITAPALPGLILEAPGDVSLVKLEQDEIEVRSSGAADVDASGKVKKLVLRADGAADFDFEALETEDADVEINGAGDVDLSATGAVAIAINGAGSVTLHRKPASLKSEINGVGSVDHAY